jgi:hypothetical protein
MKPQSVPTLRATEEYRLFTFASGDEDLPPESSFESA